MSKGQASMTPTPQELSRTHSGSYHHFEWVQLWFSYVWLSRRLDCIAVELVLCLLRRWLKRWLKSRSTISAKPGLVPVKTPTPETTATQQWTDGLLWKAGSPVLELGSTDATATRGIMATFFVCIACSHCFADLDCSDRTLFDSRSCCFTEAQGALDFAPLCVVFSKSKTKFWAIYHCADWRCKVFGTTRILFSSLFLPKRISRAGNNEFFSWNFSLCN